MTKLAKALAGIEADLESIRGRTAADAQVAYTANMDAIADLIADLQDALASNEAMTAGLVNWADAGNLAEIKSQLADTVRFATGAEEE